MSDVSTVPALDLADGRLSFRTQGSGPPLLALLPLSSGPLGIAAALSALAERFTVITYHPRGTGDSSPAPADLSMTSQAEDALALIDHLGVESLRVLAHSTGCGVGVVLAAHHAGRVPQLALVSPWSHGDAFLTSMQRLRQAAVRTLDAEQYTRFNAAILFPPWFRREHENGFERLAREARSDAAGAEVFARRLDAILAFDARPLLEHVRCPTLVCAAHDDQLMPPWFAETIIDGIEQARALWLDRGGHMLLETRGEAVVAGLLEFFGPLPEPTP